MPAHGAPRLPEVREALHRGLRTGERTQYAYYVCFSRHGYGTQECDQDRLRADELEDRVVESLLATLADVTSSREPSSGGERSWRRTGRTENRSSSRWRPEAAGPRRRWTATSGPSRRGRLRQEVCTRRIEELSAELTSLEARRSELAEEISESQPSVPDPAELAELVGDIERALRYGAPPERKAVMQAVVAEIRVRDRGHIEPVFRVPIPSAPPISRSMVCATRSTPTTRFVRLG